MLTCFFIAHWSVSYTVIVQLYSVLISGHFQVYVFMVMKLEGNYAADVLRYFTTAVRKKRNMLFINQDVLRLILLQHNLHLRFNI